MARNKSTKYLGWLGFSASIKGYRYEMSNAKTYTICCMNTVLLNGSLYGFIARQDVANITVRYKQTKFLGGT